MRKCLLVSILVLAGLLGGSNRASAFFSYSGCFFNWTCYNWGCGFPYPAFCGPGGCGGAYYYPPYYPWFAYYGYASSPYAWPNGYNQANYPAYVPGLTDHPPFSPKASLAEATVTATLPADAKLLFNGQPAEGASGTTRSFSTSKLDPAQTYEYTLTAQLTRDGKPVTVTKRVRVKAGEETKVDFEIPAEPTGVAMK